MYRQTPHHFLFSCSSWALYTARVWTHQPVVQEHHAIQTADSVLHILPERGYGHHGLCVIPGQVVVAVTWNEIRVNIMTDLGLRVGPYPCISKQHFPPSHISQLVPFPSPYSYSFYPPTHSLPSYTAWLYSVVEEKGLQVPSNLLP